jgi:hypothetical protein
MIMVILVLVGCLEPVRGEAEPLDPRFYAAGADPSAGGAGGGSDPFSGDPRPRVMVKGRVEGGAPGGVDLDVRVPDPEAPGGMRGVGKLLLPAPGPFELSVPVDVGALELQAFQDADGDGPSAGDPFARATLQVGTGVVEGVVLRLEAGAAAGGGGPVHREMPPGAPGGGGHEGGPARPGEAPPGP